MPPLSTLPPYSRLPLLFHPERYSIVTSEINQDEAKLVPIPCPRTHSQGDSTPFLAFLCERPMQFGSSLA
jgi:hypothetical protein